MSLSSLEDNGLDPTTVDIVLTGNNFSTPCTDLVTWEEQFGYLGAGSCNVSTHASPSPASSPGRLVCGG